MTSRRIITALLLSLVCAAPHGARRRAHSQPLRLTLDDAIARAVAASHRVEEARARGDAAGAVTGERHAATLPQLAAQAGYTRTNHVDEFGFLLPNNRAATSSIRTFPTTTARGSICSGRSTPAAGSTRSSVRPRSKQTAAARRHRQQRGDLRLEITRAFWALVVTGETQRVVEESLARIDVSICATCAISWTPASCRRTTC